MVRQTGVFAAALLFFGGCEGPLLTTGETGQAATASGNDKITICHQTSSSTNPSVTIEISRSAWDAHYAHGDSEGACGGGGACGQFCKNIGGPCGSDSTCVCSERGICEESHGGGGGGGGGGGFDCNTSDFCSPNYEGCSAQCPDKRCCTSGGGGGGGGCQTSCASTCRTCACQETLAGLCCTCG